MAPLQPQPMNPDAQGTGSQLEALALADFASFVETLGGDPKQIAEQVGFDLDTLKQQRISVDYEVYCELLQAAANTLQLPHFGLLFGAQHGVEIMGFLQPLVLAARDMAEAWQTASKLFNTVSRGELFLVEHWSDVHAAVRVPISPRFAHSRQAQDATITEIVSITRELMGQHWSPSAVFLSHTPADPAPYRDYFRCPVYFGQLTQAITVSDADMHRPIDESRQRFSIVSPVDSAAIERQLVEWAKPLHAQVRGVIQLTLAEGQCTLDEVATQLRLHPRTLHRRLLREGSTFRDILEHTRKQISGTLVRDTHMPFTDISDLLGYSDATAFSRAFRRWWNQSPTRLRRQAPHLS